MRRGCARESENGRLKFLSALLSTPVGRLRVVSALEGLSDALLVFVTMPLKYGLDQPEMVKVLGTSHGGLFLVFSLALLNLTIEVDDLRDADPLEEIDPPMALEPLLEVARRGAHEPLRARIAAPLGDLHVIRAAVRRAALYEAIGDRMREADVAAACWLYDQAIEDLKVYASGAAGQGDGRSRAAELQALAHKRRALG